MAHCPKCGTKNPKNNLYCRNCHHSFFQPSSQKDASNPPLQDTMKASEQQPITPDAESTARAPFSYISTNRPKKNSPLLISSIVVLAICLTIYLLTIYRSDANDDLELRFQQAEDLYKQEQYSAALKHYQKLKDTAPSERLPILEKRINAIKRLPQINDLLIRSEEAFLQGNYITPRNANTVFYIKKLLALDPGHQRARELLSLIINYYENKAQSAFNQKKYHKAQMHYTNLLSILPPGEKKLIQRVREMLETTIQENQALAPQLSSKRHPAPTSAPPVVTPQQPPARALADSVSVSAPTKREGRRQQIPETDSTRIRLSRTESQPADSLLLFAIADNFVAIQDSGLQHFNIPQTDSLVVFKAFPGTRLSPSKPSKKMAGDTMAFSNKTANRATDKERSSAVKRSSDASRKSQKIRSNRKAIFQNETTLLNFEKAPNSPVSPKVFPDDSLSMAMAQADSLVSSYHHPSSRNTEPSTTPDLRQPIPEERIDGGKRRYIKKAYPEMHRSLIGYKGFSIVKAECIIDLKGNVEKVKIISSGKNNYLNKLTLKTLKKYRYKPATRKGRPVRFKVIESIDYGELFD